MPDRHFICMVALALVAGVLAALYPPAGAFPALMLFVLGFDALATLAKDEERHG